MMESIMEPLLRDWPLWGVLAAILAIAAAAFWLWAAVKDAEMEAEEGGLPHYCLCDGDLCGKPVLPSGPRRDPERHVAIRFNTPRDLAARVFLDGREQPQAVEAYAGNPGWLVRESANVPGIALSEFERLVGYHACRRCWESSAATGAGTCLEMLHGEVTVHIPDALSDTAEDDGSALERINRQMRPVGFINNPPEAAT